MNFEHMKLQMFQIENTVQNGDRDVIHGEADTLLLEALEQLTPLVKDFDEHDALVDLIAAYKRASQYFWYV